MQSAIEPSDTAAPGPTEPSRSIWFWAGWGVVAASQLVAFWLLCNQQVSAADARRSAFRVQQMALADCLQSVPGSTMGSCQARMVSVVPTTVIVNPPAPASMGAAMPVSFNFR